MANRLYLHTIFEEILGSKNVYFQPPESLKLSYPAIVYFRKSIENIFANDYAYKQDNAYEVVVIYENPDSELPIAISKLPLCSHDRHYTSDNLNHDVFTLYF